MKNNIIESTKDIHPIDAVMKSMYLEEAMSIGMDVAENGIDSLFESDLVLNK